MNIPLDVEGSNIACTGWIPSESDKKHIGDDFFAKAVKEGEEKNSKVLFKNVSLNWDSCDCSDGFGCSHGDWVYEICITDGDKKHTLEMDDCGIIAYNEKRQAMIPEKESTVYDFYRMCELVGIKLELSDYAVSLLKPAMEVDGWIDVKDRMPENGQNCFFVTTADKKVYTGFYLAPQKIKDEGEGYNGHFRVGFIYDHANLKMLNNKSNFDCVWGIGFNVWKQNKYEVMYWMPLPAPPSIKDKP